VNKEEILAMEAGKINELCAVRVMGWEHVYNEISDSEIEDYFNNNGGKVDSFDWNPMESVADAFMVLDKFEKYEHNGNEHGHTVMIRTAKRNYYHRDKSFGKAACIAALLAEIE
jgi:hypothetical protein